MTTSINFQDFQKLEVDNLHLVNKLISKNVLINDGNNFLTIKNNNGKNVFWVDDSGCNIVALDKAVLIEDVIGFPNLEKGILQVINNNLIFSNNLDILNLDVSNANINNLKLNNLDLDKLNLQVLSSDSILNKILNSDNINSNDAKITNLINNNLTTKNIETEHINTKTLNVEIFSPKEINTDNLISNTININKAEINELKVLDVGIDNLECKKILAHNVDIIETANIKLLNNEEAYIDNLIGCNAEIKILKVHNIIKPLSLFGSLTEPLNLNMAINTSLDLNNEEGNIKIFNKIIKNTPQNKFELINLANNEYNVITKVHNGFNNINYNICLVDGKKWLFTKINELKNDIIVEIHLDKI
jgi:hypothetical protein